MFYLKLFDESMTVLVYNVSTIDVQFVFKNKNSIKIVITSATQNLKKHVIVVLNCQIIMTRVQLHM